jgi:hypothetical protein
MKRLHYGSRAPRHGCEEMAVPIAERHRWLLSCKVRQRTIDQPVRLQCAAAKLESWL